MEVGGENDEREAAQAGQRAAESVASNRPPCMHTFLSVTREMQMYGMCGERRAHVRASLGDPRTVYLCVVKMCSARENNIYENHAVGR